MLRSSLDNLPGSRIREVANAGMASPRANDIVRFWFGEGDLPTPEFIRDAARRSLDAGETFYNHNLGIPELREAIAAGKLAEMVAAFHAGRREQARG